MKPSLADLDTLPDDALVNVVTVATLAGLSRSTVWRKAQTDPRLKPVSLGHMCTRFRLGGVRAFIAGAAEQPK